MWQVRPSPKLPDWIIPEIQRLCPNISGKYLSQLLLSRGISTPQQLANFLQINHYQPASPQEFGSEMQQAVGRLTLAYQRCTTANNREKIAIWGDFDADGITATAVLWEGLRQFFGSSLSYTIPNRLTDSHGLNQQGIEALASDGCTLIITCDTGSTNLAELELARNLGIDVIITDHHTLPTTRPPVVAIINPRNLPTHHPLYHLSGVAVAYKLVEALYRALPEVPQGPLEDLLDLVAIGLIADLVELKGDCHYLAKQGIKKLKLQTQLKQPTRPGVAELLKLCKRNGDRPTDISFGIGPRINAVSRIYGDASFCVELLTSQDQKQAKKLATTTEIANTRRRELQKDVAQDVQKKLQKLDLSTTHAIILTDPQWSTGVLGLVAGQIAQEYNRPTILLTTEGAAETGLARGSARSVNQIDLYDLVYSQAELLHRFGGHPFAAGLSLPIENIPLFTEGINQQLRQKMGGILLSETNIIVDLVCTVAELGGDLFQELKLLEPCGMGNPVPKLLIKNCCFKNIFNKNQEDLRKQKVKYIKTTYNLWDDSTSSGFPGVWWGHYSHELPPGQCDAIVELDFNTYTKKYEVRLLAVGPSLSATKTNPESINIDEIVDFRNRENADIAIANISANPDEYLILTDCPHSWDELNLWFRHSLNQGKKLAIAYSQTTKISPLETWKKLVGIAKYLSRTHQGVSHQKLLNQLSLGDISLKKGFNCLNHLGFKIEYDSQSETNLQFYFTLEKSSKNLNTSDVDNHFLSLINIFFDAIKEEQFKQQYFCEVPLDTIQKNSKIGQLYPSH